MSDKSACHLGQAIAKGEVTPSQLTEEMLNRAQGHPLVDRIFARLCQERAMAEAQAADHRARAGTRRHILDGVPLSWKDLFDVAGYGTEAGSKLLQGRVPEHDAIVVARTAQLGAVALGKTHMSELAFSGLGLNPMTATSPCVNDPEAVSGGSSSGAAASVAFGLAPATVGSDTGGSIRVPSAWNDLVGFKPTHDLLPLTGVVPLAPKFDTVGPICRTVEDAMALFSMLQGDTSVQQPQPCGALRLAVLSCSEIAECDAAPQAAFGHACTQIRAAGHYIEHVEDERVSQMLGLSAVLYTSEAYGLWRDAIEAAPDAMYPPILERFRQGAQFDAPAYVAAWHQLEQLRTQIWQDLRGYDAVLLPTVPILPPKQRRLEEESAYYVRANLMTLRNTRVGNLLGACAITLPSATPSCGVMALAPPHHDRALLNIAAAIEAPCRQG